MSRFFESIKLLNGQIFNFAFHVKRMNKTYKYHYGVSDFFSNLSIDIPKQYREGLFKLKILYDKKIDKILFEEYQARNIKAVKIIDLDKQSYGFKYSDRKWMDAFASYIHFEHDVLFVKNGRIRESSFSNICLWDGKQWFTPKYPLHKGTKRAFLIENQLVQTKDIRIAELKQYKRMCFVNAFLDIGDLCVPVSKIK